MGAAKDGGTQGSGKVPDSLGSIYQPYAGRARPAPPGTYKHFNGDRDSAVQRGVASVLGHDRQINQPIGYLFVIQGVVHADHCNDSVQGGGVQMSL